MNARKTKPAAKPAKRHDPDATLVALAVEMDRVRAEIAAAQAELERIEGEGLGGAPVVPWADASRQITVAVNSIRAGRHALPLNRPLSELLTIVHREASERHSVQHKALSASGYYKAHRRVDRLYGRLFDLERQTLSIRPVGMLGMAAVLRVLATRADDRDEAAPLRGLFIALIGHLTADPAFSLMPWTDDRERAPAA